MERTFEASLNELEKVVTQLEAGDLPLETSLKLFEDGVRLARECRERLTEAERRIEVLMQDGDGKPALAELEPGELRGERKRPAKRIVFETGEEPPF